MDVALQLLNLQPEPGDQRIGVRVHRLGACGNGLGFTAGRPLGKDQCVGAGKVVRKLIGRIGHGKMESYSLAACQRFCSSG